MWRRRFAADPSIVGRVVNVDGIPCTVIGVLGPAFQLPMEFESASSIDVIRPIRLDPAAPRIKRGGHYLYGVARLQPGVTVRAAAAEMDGINASLMREYPDQYNQGGFGIDVTPLRDALLGDSRPVIMVLAGAVGLVLLLACANVANLLLARGESRGRELAVRTALGASRLRIIRQLLTESVLLSLAGAAAGLAVAGWCQRAILSVAPAALPRLASVSLDRPVLLFAMALGVSTGVLFGIDSCRARVARPGDRIAQGRRPRQHRCRPAPRAADAGRRAGRDRRRAARGGWTAAEKLHPADGTARGHRHGTRAHVQVSLPAARYAGRPEVAGFFSRLLDRVSRAAGRGVVGRGHADCRSPLRRATGASTSKGGRGSTAATAALPTGTS